MSNRRDRFVGCLLGAAIGDALGIPGTGRTKPAGVETGALPEYADAPDARAFVLPLQEQGDSEMGDSLTAGQWSDDTQLTLALAETLAEEAGLFIPEAWQYKLVRWLSSEPRAPGLSSLHAAMQFRMGGFEWNEAADPEGAGCGAATRVAPVGLLYARDPLARRAVAVTQAQMTHGHPDASAAALAVAEAVAAAIAMTAEDLAAWDGIRFLDSLREKVERASPEYAEFANCIKLAGRLLEDDVETATAIRVLGVSAWSREAVPCALYIVARTPGSFEAMMADAVGLTSNAVESIATLVGAIGGALHGEAAVPLPWLEGLEEAGRITEVAEALFHAEEQRIAE